MAGTYTEAGIWPIQMRALHTGLRHIHRLLTARDGASLLQTFRGRPNLHMGALLMMFEERIEVPHRPRLQPPPPDTGEALRITTTLHGVRNKRSPPPQAIRHEAVALIKDDLGSYLHVFTDGSVKHSTDEAAA